MTTGGVLRLCSTWRRALARGCPALLLAFLMALAGCGDDSSPIATAPEPIAPTDPNDPGDPDVPEPPEAEPVPDPSPTPTPQPPNGLRRLCFSPQEDCVQVLLGYLREETGAVDVAIYHLYDRRISDVLIQKHRAGQRVRVIGDRHAYNAKPQHKREMDYLASNGVPVQTNRHNGIIHHKVMLLHGQGIVLNGSMNFTSLASRKILVNGQVQWNEETAFFTDERQVFARFAERFERMWTNGGPATEAFQPFTAGMDLPTLEESEANPPTTCYEDPEPDPRPLPDNPEIRICFSPDQHCNREVIAPIISNESRRIDAFVFRITVQTVAAPLLEKVKAGVPIRLIIERSQYNNPLYPSMTAILNDLWAANTKGNLQIKATNHPGFMHMKSIITPDVATWSSGNYTSPSSKRVRGCQRSYYQDEDTAVTRDPALVARVQRRFDQLWASPDFAPFVPDQPVPSPSP
jgi:phosphatidylserine/phosphatidylglycerophosphate/cardiolipin synthase-like enzyme